MLSDVGGSVVVETTAGAVAGRSEGDHLAYLGLPYARPPTGSRRFRPPEPAEPWTDLRPARGRGPIAPQMRLRKGPVYAPDGDEDCLYLDVRTPGIGPELHPVLVWLHGGAFQWGTSDIEPMFGEGRLGGARLAQQGIVTVSVSYRLGALGWLALDEIDSSYAGSGNNGLLDQLTALDWVQRNIERFGGDPDRVTVAGQSAGAIATATLLCGPGRGAFRQAILMSGAASSTATMSRATEIADAMFDQLGVSTTNELQAVPPDDLLRAQFAVTRSRGSLLPGPDTFLTFGPVVDGEVVTEDPLDAARRGVGREVRVLLGTNEDEFRNVAIRQAEQNITREDLVVALADRAPAGVVDAYIDRIGADRLVETCEALRSDMVFRLPAIDFADARTAHDAPTYRYFHSRHAGAGSASHGSQVGLFFDLYEEPPWPDLTRLMSEYLRTFVEEGAPRIRAGGPEWPAFGRRRSTMVFAAESRARDDPDAAIRQLWRGKD